MLVEEAISASVTYVEGSNDIQIPVYLDSSNNVFAPPFIIPKETWHVHFTLHQPEGQPLVFESVTFDSCVDNLTIDNPDAEGETEWNTTFGNTVTDVNMLSCTITLKNALNGPEDLVTRYSGDPTIAVVKDPLG